MKFSKLHGAGNDFILLKAQEIQGYDRHELARKACDRHFGVGSDGMMVVDVVEEHIKADVRMSFYNADGTLGVMCGNGIRCFAKFVYENKIVTEKEFLVQTGVGVLKVDLTLEKDQVSKVKVNMGVPVVSSDLLKLDTSEEQFLHKEVTVDEKTYDMSILSLGAMHAVLIVEDVKAIDLVKLGSTIENSNIFFDKSNVNICQVVSDNRLIVHTWEKGVGLTLACGTGCASAAYVTAMEKGIDHVDVETKGGILSFELVDGNIFMTGPAVKICEGEFEMSEE